MPNLQKKIAKSCCCIGLSGLISMFFVIFNMHIGNIDPDMFNTLMTASVYIAGIPTLIGICCCCMYTDTDINPATDTEQPSESSENQHAPPVQVITSSQKHTYHLSNSTAGVQNEPSNTKIDLELASLRAMTI